MTKVFIKCSQDECKCKLNSVMMFRYQCSGCKRNFCPDHLDWEYGHACPEREYLHSIKQSHLENQMPRIVPDKINKI